MISHGAVALCSTILRSHLPRSVPKGPSPPVPTGEVVPVQRAELLLQTEDAERQVRGGHDQEADAGDSGTSTSAQQLAIPAFPRPPAPQLPLAHSQHNEDLQELVVGGSQLRHAALLHLQLLLGVYCTF